MTTKTSQGLYAHIHHLLDEHVATHLTTNYVDCTQSHVYEALLGGLMPVAVDDPHSLVPASDPLDDFVRKCCQIEPKYTWERLIAVKKAQDLINRTVKAALCETVLTTNFPDTFCGCDFQVSDYFPDPPVLTLRSIRHTPKPEFYKLSRFCPSGMREILSQYVKTSVLEEAFEDNIDIQTGDPTHSRLTIDSHRWKEITSLYRANPFSTQQTSGTEHPLPNWPPSPPLLASCPQTPPLFSRISTTSGQPSRVPRAMVDLPLMTPLASSDDDKGMPEYLATIDGWSASATSPPATPSLDDRASKIHDIFVPPSDSPRPINDLLAAEMDMVCMPRQSGTGGSRWDLRVPGQGKLLHEYIGTIVDMARCPKTPTPAASPDDSTLAHHDRAILMRNNMWQCSNDTEEAFLDHLTPDFPYGTVDTVLVDKSADLGDESMQVPPMPPPNVHTHHVVWPSDMSSLVTDSAFLTIKGTKSLNFELTWRPYDSEQVIPTLEELVGVSEHHYSPANIYGDLGGSRAQITELLNQLDPLTQPITIEEENQRMLRAVSRTPLKLNSVAVILGSFNYGNTGVLLTRAERHRSRSRHDPLLERGSGRAVRLDDGGCTAQTPDCHRKQSTESIQTIPLEWDYMVDGCAFPSEGEHRLHHMIRYCVRKIDVTLGAENDIITVLKDPALISCLEGFESPSPDQIYLSEVSGLDGNDSTLAGAKSASVFCGEQSLGGFLSALGKQPLLARPGYRTLPAPPDRIEQGGSTLPIDTERLLHELEKLAAPLPPLEVSSCRNHRYLASVELLQDRLLSRALHLASLRIELREREWLNGADLVFDCDTALVFSPLFQIVLPSSFHSLKSKLCSLSWRYTHIVVVFKLYGSGLQSHQEEEGRAELFSRVIKFVKKLHRDLALAEAYETKRPQAVVQVHFVRSIEQAATMARLLGDIAESRSQFGPWDDRLWLGVDEQEDERYLSSVDGMNAFAAAAILSQISLRDFLALHADQRLQLALPIPEGMMQRFNEVIAQRSEDVKSCIGSDDDTHAR